MSEFFITEVLLHRQVLLTTIKADHDTCHLSFIFTKTEMLKKALRLQDSFCNGICGFDFKHLNKCLKQKKKLNKHLVCIHIYEHRYELSAINPVQFLRMKTSLLQLHDSQLLTLHTNQLSIDYAIKKKDLMESLIEIKIRDGGKWHLQNERLLKLMLPISPNVTGVLSRHKISCVTSERACINDSKSLILTNKAGETLHQLEYLCHDSYSGLHTVNSDDELFYIDEDYNIKNLSRDMNRTTLFIETMAPRRKL